MSVVKPKRGPQTSTLFSRKNVPLLLILLKKTYSIFEQFIKIFCYQLLYNIIILSGAS